jgi:lipopolysaccharide export system protein LptC
MFSGYTILAIETRCILDGCLRASINSVSLEFSTLVLVAFLFNQGLKNGSEMLGNIACSKTNLASKVSSMINIHKSRFYI